MEQSGRNCRQPLLQHGNSTGRAGTRGLLLVFHRRPLDRADFGLFKGIGRPLTPSLALREIAAKPLSPCGRGSGSASKYPKPYVLLEAYRLAYDCKSMREQLWHAGPLPGAGDFQAVGAVVEDARDDELSVVCQLVEASGNGLVDALID